MQPRMPWHDVACCVEGPVVTDLARHFVQRYNQESPQKWKVEIICLKQNFFAYPFSTVVMNLIPNSYEGVTSEQTPGKYMLHACISCTIFHVLFLLKNLYIHGTLIGCLK